MTDLLLSVTNVGRRFRLKRGLFGRTTDLIAVDNVSFFVQPGKSLGIVGESGSGKSTLARLIMALDRPDTGVIRLLGKDLNAQSPRELQHLRRHFQMVFQDPRGSLDPRMTVERIIAEPLDVAEPNLGAARQVRIIDALAAVGLEPASLKRYPHEFSGGQRQRIAIARALVTTPALVVADEPVSALDVSIQAQVLNLMMDLQQTRNLTYVFISHDLAVVEHVADNVIVMFRGRIVEQGPAAALFHSPAHPYTQALVAAASDMAGTWQPGHRLEAKERDLTTKAQGCAYAPTCPISEAACLEQVPELRPLASDPERSAACFKPLQ
jgi:peptide/nickel transport system ATP-binding protein